MAGDYIGIQASCLTHVHHRKCVARIRWLNTVGAQCNATHAEHSQRPYKRAVGHPPYKYYGSVANTF